MLKEREEREWLEEKIGKTLKIYRELAITMNSFPREENVSIKDLAEAAQVHYNTAKKALLFFDQLESVIPTFEIRGTCFRVVSKPNALEAVEGIFESLEMRVLTKMMLVMAVDSEKARKLEDLLTEQEKSILPKLIEEGFINSLEGRYFLSVQGKSLGTMGLRQIVNLNIPLPWEKQVSTPITRKVEPKRVTLRESFLEPYTYPVSLRCFSTEKRRFEISRKTKITLHSYKQRGFICATFKRP